MKKIIFPYLILRDCNEITWLFYGKINKLLYELNSFISNHKITK